MGLKNKTENPGTLFLKIVIIAAAVFPLVMCAPRNNGIRASGTIEATEIRISSRSTGEILSVDVKEGGQVKKGDVIARIDDYSLTLMRDQAKAGIAQAQAGLALLLKGARLEDIRQAEEMLIQAQEAFNQAKEDYQRMDSLFKSGSVTQKQADDAKTRYTVAMAQLNSAQQALTKLKNLVRPEDLAIAQAQLDQASTSLALLEKQISDCVITAPSDGTVVNRLVEPGEFAAVGSPIAVIADLGQMSLTIYVGESDLGKIQLDQKAYVTIDSYPDRRFEGKVESISTQAEFTPKNIQTKEERIKQVFGVKIGLPNPDGALKAGLPADADIPVAATAAAAEAEAGAGTGAAAGDKR